MRGKEILVANLDCSNCSFLPALAPREALLKLRTLTTLMSFRRDAVELKCTIAVLGGRAWRFSLENRHADSFMRLRNFLQNFQMCMNHLGLEWFLRGKFCGIRLKLYQTLSVF